MQLFQVTTLNIENGVADREMDGWQYLQKYIWKYYVWKYIYVLQNNCIILQIISEEYFFLFK